MAIPVRTGHIPGTHLPVDLLCDHFELGDFDCGSPVQNLDVEHRVNSFYDPADVCVLVAHEGGLIRGFLTVCDLVMRLDTGGTAPEELCFFLASFGVDVRWKRSPVAGDLISAAYYVRNHRTHRPYAATLATTLHNPEFTERLRRRRFAPVPGTDETYWFLRPRR